MIRTLGEIRESVVLRTNRQKKCANRAFGRHTINVLIHVVALLFGLMGLAQQVVYGFDGRECGDWHFDE